MATLYDYLSPDARNVPLDSLSEKQRKFLGTEVPAGYPQSKLTRVVALAERGMSRYAAGARGRQPDVAPAGGSAWADTGPLDESLGDRKFVNPFEKPEPEPATYDIYRKSPGIVKAAARVAQQVYPFVSGVPRMADEFIQWQSGMDIPERDKIPARIDIVPPAGSGTERAADLAGSLLGFTAATATGEAAGLPALAALGMAGALPEEGARNRTIAAGTTMAAGQLSHAVGAKIAPEGASLLRRAGAGATGAVAFGAAEPAARTLTQRLTGDPNYPAPTLEDLVRGTGELGAVNLLGLASPAARAGAGRLALDRMERERAAREGDYRTRGVVPPEVAAARAMGPENARGVARQTEQGVSGVQPLPENRQLPSPGSRRRRLPAAPEESGRVFEMPAGEGAPPAVFPAGRRLPPGPTPPAGEPIQLGPGKTVAENRAPVLEKVAPEFATDRRQVSAGQSVADVFARMVEQEAGGAESRADWKAAARRVVASGRIQAVQDIAEAMAEPADASRRGATPELRAREARFSDELNQRAAGRVVTLNIGGEPTKLRIARVVTFRYPGVEKPVRVIAEDVANGRLFPLRFNTVGEFSTALNNPQALVKVEDVFARSERQRAIRQQRGPAGAGASEGAPAASPGEAAPAAPPAAEGPRPNVVKIVSEKAEALRERVARAGGDRRRVARENAPERRERGPIPPDKVDEYVRRYAEGYAAKHAKAPPELQQQIIDDLKRRAVDEADAVDRRAAVEALDRIRGGQAGPVESAGTGPEAPPAAPAAKPKRVLMEQKVEKRTTVAMEFGDAKKAQAVADAMNKRNPAVDAKVVMKRGKPFVEVNEDAATSPPPERRAPKAEPAAAPAPAKPGEQGRLGGMPPPVVGQERGRAPSPEAESLVESMGGEAKGFAEWFADYVRRGSDPEAAAREAEAQSGQKRPDGFDPAREAKAVGRKALEDAGQGNLLKPEAAPEPPAKPEAGKPAAEEGSAGGGPEESPVAAPAEDSPAALAERSRFKAGDRVSVPNNAIRRNDTRSRVEARVVGHEMKNGEPHVIVDVQRGTGRSQSKNLVQRAENAGKFTWVRESFPESKVIKKATAASRAAAQDKKAKKAVRLEDSIRERAAGSPAKARAIIEEWNAKEREIMDAAPKQRELGHGRLAPFTEAEQRAYDKAREAAKRAAHAAYLAQGVHDALVREKLGGRPALHPDVEPFFLRSEDAPDWTNPMREAAEDFPEHFTHDRQAAYVRRAAAFEVGNAREWKAAIDQERAMAERGVSPEHAAAATDATARLRRFIEMESDNPLQEEADLQAYRDLLKPERIDTPEALAETLKEFDKLSPPGPADDIPAGVQPIPPEGFVEDLSQKGFVNAEVLSPWFWLKALRDIPRNYARSLRNLPRAERRYSTYDGSGNLVDRGNHQLYEPDYYSESALTRLLARFAVEPGAHVFTPEQRVDYKASISDQAHLETYWHWRRVQALGADLAERVRPYSKLSVQLDRVLEGRAPESSLPPDVRPAVEAMRRLYADYWEYVKGRYTELGLDPPTSALEEKYVGPRIILGHISKTVDRVFADFLKEVGPTPEVTEMRNRFLHERTGDPNYREDSALRFEEYNRTMSKHLAFLGFFERLRADIRKMEVDDYARASAIVNMLKATLLRKKGDWERRIDRAASAIRFAKSSPDIREISLASAASYIGVDKTLLKKGSGIERVFVVPAGARYRVGSDAREFELGRTAGGERIVGTGGAHLFGDAPEIRAPERALAKAAIRAKVAVRGAAEKVNKALTGEEGGYLSPHFSQDEHVHMEFEKWRDGVLRSQDNLVAAAFRSMGDRITKSVLAYNMRASLANSMQVWLTLAPEIGYRRTAQAVIENVLSSGRGKRAAEMTGSLQGELARTGELTDQPSWFRRVMQALGPMAPYKYAEDFTRGVGMMGASYMAKRMGMKPGVAQDMSANLDQRFFDEWRAKIDAVRQSGTTENLQATLDTETMFDYNLLGQSPIFGGALGKVLGRLMTFPGRYARRYVTRPLGGAAKVARAVALGTVDRATGGALERAGMRTGAGERFVNGRQVRGKYAAPTNAFEDFLDYYGARWHDRQGAKVMLRQMQMLGFLSAITGGTNLNAFIVGTPGWERLPLLVLLSFTKQGSPLHKKIKGVLDATQRSAVIDPERSAELTMSPLVRTAVTAAGQAPEAWRSAYAKAEKGDRLGTAAALAKPLTTALQETGLQMLGAPLIAIRRGFQQMPMAEPFFKSDAGKAFAHLMGIRSYVKGNGAIGFLKGFTGLTTAPDEDARRVKVDQKPKKPRLLPKHPRRPLKLTGYADISPAVSRGVYA